MSTLSQLINDKLSDKKPAQIVYGTIAVVALASLVHKVIAPGFLPKRILKTIFLGFRTVAAPLIRKEIRKAAAGVTFPQKSGELIFDKLPDIGLSEQEVLHLCEELHQSLDHPFEKGGCSGTVYHGGKAYTDMINRVMEIFQWSNPLHVEVFGATRKMEAEIASMVVKMYKGDILPDACAAVTSGGSESISMAVKVYRDWGLKVLSINKPSIVMPITAHPGFDKAASYYGVELIKVPVGASGSVDPKQLAEYITANTVAIVGSAPTFPHGTIDPIEELSDIAYERGIGLHVDACLGGFIVPFMEAAGFPEAPVVDFRLKGVTSISCDTHKYGFAPKGTSVIMYRSKALRSHQFFTIADWPGGIYCSPGASGSKPGNVIAGTWAAMIHQGTSGYIDSCRKIVNARKQITDGISTIPGIKILGTPTASVFAFSSDEIDIYILDEGLKKRGWMLNSLQFPAGLQFSVTLLQTHPDTVSRFVTDVRELTDEQLVSIAARRKMGEVVKIGVSGATMYGSQQKIPDRSILDMVMSLYLDSYYETHHPTKNSDCVKD
eukprot:Tbor_TRINITY_DN5001_c0_g5::TRINITY_DN5001_c0_g5_i1::g.14420::m.14420/K01634/SGPL1, DPL1; sphinganine-1-phosphate aldolase